ncbi:MAG: hypothetical protein U0235_02675 [Polyangiaceae bacterium]
MRRLLSLALLLVPSLALSLGCSAGATEDGAGSADGDEMSELTSHEAVFLDFSLRGEVVAPAGVPARQAIVTQLFYTEGRLTHFGGNTRPGFVRVKDVTATPAADGSQRITYSAVLPVLWPANQAQPKKYQIAVPKKVDQDSLDAFNAKYDGKCGTNEYGQATFWHDFDPTVDGCKLEADTLRTTATAKPSSGVVADTYPEYDKIYADGALKVVSVVGLDGFSDQPTDLGTRDFEALVRDVTELSHGTVTEGAKTDFIYRDVTIRGTVSGKKYEHRVFLAGAMEIAPAEFEARFGPATADADLVTYDGHSGLGKNIRGITSRGTVTPGQYQVWFLDGCNSLGYLDDDFTAKRRQANGGQDTKFVDIIGNGLPSLWPGDETTSFRLIRSLADLAHPKTYSAILEEFPGNQVPAVVGDEDNAFKPGH